MDNYNQGKLKRIAELFIKPLLPVKPHHMSLKKWLNEIFHVDTREIAKYRAKRTFNMLGYYSASPSMKLKGAGYRKVPRNALLWIRFDSTTPDKIEIEVKAGKGRKSQVFELNQDEWRKTEPYVRRLKQ